MRPHFSNPGACQSQLIRCLWIIEASRTGISFRAMRHELGIGTRTLRRDLTAIRAAGVRLIVFKDAFPEPLYRHCGHSARVEARMLRPRALPRYLHLPNIQIEATR